jgi:hypothetical protein
MNPSHAMPSLPAPEDRERDASHERSLDSGSAAREAERAISPELALVSPELAERERTRFRHQPWDIAMRGVDVPRVLDGTEATARSRRRRRFPRRGHARMVAPVLAAALAVVFAVISLERASGPSPAVTPPVDATNGVQRAERSGVLFSRSGYVVTPAGSFMTGASGRMIEFFTLPLRCGSGQLVIRNVPVSRGRLRFTGQQEDGVTVQVWGRVLDRERMRGYVTVSGPGCGARRVAFAARLS